MTPTDSTPDARGDLEYLRAVLARAERRVDPHAFHFVHWGLIVLVLYPLLDWLYREGHSALAAAANGVALLLGTTLSVVRERRLSRHSRLEGADAVVGHQVMAVAMGSVAAGIVLSIAGAATRFADGQAMPVFWGLAYAAMTGGVAVVYRREFVWSAIAILLATCAAMAFPAWSGTILGPVMGLGLAIPGARAERRVRRLAEGDDAAAVA